MSKEFYKDDAEKQVNEETGREVIPNKERGCGFLQPNKAYIRSDASRFGALPAFVKFTEPVEPEKFIDEFAYKEGEPRGWMKIDSTKFELAHQDDIRYELLPKSYTEEGIAFLIAASDSEYEDREDVPDSEIERHLDRLRWYDEDEDQLGSMKTWQAHDIMMRVGASHYPEPEDFIQECVTQGLNKAIASGSNTPFPKVVEGRTKLYVVHPNALEYEVDAEDDPEVEADTKTVRKQGVIGYVYLTRVIYTEDEDGKVPDWMKEREQAKDYVDIVEIGEKIPEEEDRPEQELENFESDKVEEEDVEPGIENRTVDEAKELIDECLENPEGGGFPDKETVLQAIEERERNTKNRKTVMQYIEKKREELEDQDKEEEQEEEQEEDTEEDDIFVEEEREDVVIIDCDECGASIKEAQGGDTDYECMNGMCGKTFTEEDIKEMRNDSSN